MVCRYTVQAHVKTVVIGIQGAVKVSTQHTPIQNSQCIQFLHYLIYSSTLILFHVYQVYFKESPILIKILFLKGYQSAKDKGLI